MKESEINALAGQGKFQGRILHGAVEETHISWVILSGRFAFKIKKPVKLSFLDFSTLARRKKYCEKEVVLNRRFSTIYLGVVPVRSAQGIWRIGRGKGEVRDYAVKMKRMDSAKRMDFLLQAGKVTPDHIVALAKCISAIHNRAEIVHSDFDLSFSREAFNDIRAIGSFVTRVFPGRFSHILSEAVPWSDSFLRSYSRRLNERVALGFKRDLHGDLHSGNIFLYQHPVIFDCIEFNDVYRHIDVIDEIAFFCMDLEAYGYKRLSQIFQRAYRSFSSSVATLEDRNIFNYFKCYRANVRAKVHALAALQENEEQLYQKHLKALRKYLLLMDEYIRADRKTRA